MTPVIQVCTCSFDFVRILPIDTTVRPCIPGYHRLSYRQCNLQPSVGQRPTNIRNQARISVDVVKRLLYENPSDMI